MATFESDLKTLLGNIVSGRCYPLVNTQPTIVLPYITYQVITETPLVQGQKKLRIQVDVFSETYGEAKTLAESIKTAMNEETFLTNSFIAQQDLYEEANKEYRELLEFYVWP